MARHSTQRGFLLLRIAILWLALCAWFTPISHAATPAADMDVVLLMDSSGSMKKTDPHELRKPAAKLFVSLLGGDDRASIVSFSDEGYPVVYLAPAKGDGNQERLFKAVDKISAKGIYTNLYDAVAKAREVLNKPERPASRRIIILMSDGKMDLGAEQRSTQRAGQLLNELIPQVKGQGIQIHTIAFTDESDKDLLGRIAGGTGGQFHMARTDKDLHEVYAALFEHDKAPDMLPFNGDQFTVDTSIEEVTVVGSKEKAGIILSLIAPAGVVMTATDKPKDVKWMVTPLFDMVTITKPESGVWSLKYSAGKNRAYVITDLKLQVSVNPAAPLAGETLSTRAWLEQKDTPLTMKNLLSVVTMSQRIQLPDDSNEVKELAVDAKSGSLTLKAGEYGGEYLLKQPGRYKIDITAVSGTFAREKTVTIDVRENVGSLSLTVPDKEKAVPAKKAEQKAVAKKDSPPAMKKDAHNEDKSEDKGGILKGVLLFVGVNALLAGIIAGVIYYRKKRKAKPTEEEAENK